MKNSIHNADTDIYILTKEQFGDTVYKNQRIAEGNSAWIMFIREEEIPESTEEADILLIAKELIDCGQANVYTFADTALKSCLDHCGHNKSNKSESLFFSRGEEKAQTQAQCVTMTSMDLGAQILSRFDERICAFLMQRSSFAFTGCFHEFLGAGNNLEFAVRAADHRKTVWVEPADSKNVTQHNPLSIDEENDIIKAIAYCCCNYQTRETMPQGFDEILRLITEKLQKQGLMQIFIKYLGGFVQDPGLFYSYVRNTAPIYIISGDDTAYGVLKDFAEKLAKAFAKKGQAVITTDGRYLSYRGIEDIEGKTLKAVIGFQAPVLFRDFFRKIQAPKFQFWFDDPVFFDHLFDNITDDDSYYMLCQDGLHAEHFREHYHLKNAMHFPPGGTDEGMPDFENRDLDIVFIGTWRKAEKPAGMGGFAKAYCDYMLSHPGLTYEQGVREVLHMKNIKVLPETKKDTKNARDDSISAKDGQNSEITHENYMELLWSLAPVYRYIRGVYRNHVIDDLLQNGIQIHVYGDSWNDYEPVGIEVVVKTQNDGRTDRSEMGRDNIDRAKNNISKNLIIHPQVSPVEAVDVLRRAKLSLNIMSWHKAGMTERIINSMLCGAVCVTDETQYLKEHFSEEEMLLFQLCPLKDGAVPASGERTDATDPPQNTGNTGDMSIKDLADRIGALLADDEKRISMVKAAYVYAAENETWERRVEQLLKSPW
ncbi:MAG: glycosyltransferase [Lachnospiraceae bacterium]|nr:glycosyltransferase [Lachnospiraceae bacterium]